MGNETSETLRKLAAALGASGVGLGAFGAHALKGYLNKKPEGSNNWKTAVSYQLLHAVALLSLSCLEEGKPRKYQGGGGWSGGKIMALGTVLFSGSIYLLTLDIGPKRILGPMTPVGGLMLMSGWAMIGAGKI
mmetsp:Transcript_20994/g.31109  ORF Transcript_20994/g.31109 Transcript_20994/m.31109 type:complete len:133 (-) Transcript_20994:1170-1568(-)